MSDEEPIRRVERPRRPGPPEMFDGHVELEPVLELDGLGLRQARVHFHDGARTHWHLHRGDQVLYFVEGRGMAEDLGGTRLDCSPGDVVHVPPGTRHRHGAAEGSSATHVAITAGESIWEGDTRYPG